MDDLVAELTLKIRNDIEAGIDEIRGEFGGLGDTLANLNSTLTSLDETLRGLQAPVALTDGLAEAAASARDTSAAIASIDPASAAAADAIQGIGAAIDEDAAKMQNLLTQMYQAQDDMHQIASGGAPAGATDDGRSGNSDGGGGSGGGGGNNDEGGGGGSGRRNGHNDTVIGGGVGLLSDAFMGQIAFSAMDAMARQYADFAGIATQITITEGLNGDPAMAERKRLEDLTDQTALKYAASSKDLMESYEYLITDRVPKAQVEAMLPSLAEASTAYNVPALRIANAAFAELRMLNIAPDQIGDSLAVLHHAAMQGHFGIGDFGTYLGQIAAQGNVMGITGAKGNVVLASALEAIQEQTNDAGETDTELKNLLQYLREPIALRSFDPTKRTLSMDSAAGRRLRQEYHLPDLDLNKYLNDELKQGVDPINAMIQFFEKYTSNVKSQIDLGDIFGMYFHNQTAAQAFMGLYQQRDIFGQMQTSLSNVSDATLGTDYQTARQGPVASVNLLDEQFAQLRRELGENVIPTLVALGTAANVALETLNGIGHLWDRAIAAPVGSAIGTGAAYFEHYIGQYVHPGRYNPALLGNPDGLKPQPIDIHLKVSADGTVTQQPGGTSTPGVNVRVNQGSVLNGVH